jgi:hypothetical protein
LSEYPFSSVPVPNLSLQKYNYRIVDKANMTVIIVKVWLNVLEEIAMLFEDHQVLAHGTQMLN